MITILKRVSSFFKSFLAESQAEGNLAVRLSSSRRAQIEPLESRELLAAFPYPNYYGPPTFEEYQASFAVEDASDFSEFASLSAYETPVITVDVLDAKVSPEFESDIPAELSGICIEEIEDLENPFESFEVAEGWSTERVEITEVLLDLTNETLLTPEETNIGGGGDSTQSGGSGGASGGSGGAGGSDLKPYVSGGGTVAYYDAVFSADSTTILQTPGNWCVSEDPSDPLTYSYTSTCSEIVSIEYFDSNTGTVSIIPNGHVGVGTITVTASNTNGSCTETISVYCGRVIGYSVEEQTYGSEDWNSVYDSGGFEDNSSETPWMMLWHENKYRWKPIFENGVTPQSFQIRGVYFDSISKDLVSSASDSTLLYTRFAGSDYTPIITSGGGDVIENLPDSDWPCAIGSPANFGEIDITATVSVSGYNFHQQGYYLGCNACELPLRHLQMATKLQPRVALNRVFKVEWQAVDSNNDIRFGYDPNVSTQYRCFPEKQQASSEFPACQIDVGVSLCSPIPVGMKGTVFANYFDPPNRYENENQIVRTDIDGVTKCSCSGDNNGALMPLNTNYSAIKIEFTSDDSLFNLTKKVVPVDFKTAYAGDNYLFAVHPNNIVDTKYEIKKLDKIDAENNSNKITYFHVFYRNDNNSESSVLVQEALISSVLNVWRTLHVETDVFQKTDSNIVADEPDVSGTVKDELERANIRVVKCDKNPRNRIVASDIVVHRLSSSTVTVDSNTPVPEAQDNNDSTYNYWVIYGVGAFTTNDPTLLGLRHDGSFIFLTRL